MAVFINVMALMAVLLLAPHTALGQAPETCSSTTNGRHYCQDCKTGVRCGSSGPPQPYVTCTHPGEVCVVLDATATCVPLEDSPCSCDKPQQCDAYDDSALLVCLDEGSSIFVSQCPYDQLCISDTCVENPCNGAFEDRFNAIKPECTAAAYCLENSETTNGTIIYCNASQYFDPEKSGCATSPPVPCDENCMGACVDKSDCNRYYVCDGQGHVDDVQECEDPNYPYFDSNAKICTNDATLCTPTDGCDFNATTTQVWVE